MKLHTPLSLRRTLLVALLLAPPVFLSASAVESLSSFTDGATALAGTVNANFDKLQTAVDDNDSRLDAMAHPLGIYTDPGCRTGYSFVALASGNLGYCAKLFNAGTAGRTSFFNMRDCVDDGGRGATAFEIWSMIDVDVSGFQTMAAHTGNSWEYYADGFNQMTQHSKSHTGPVGMQINPGQPCTNNATNTCGTGDLHWDLWSQTTDVNNAGQLICVLGPGNAN